MKIRTTANLTIIDDVFTSREIETMDNWFAQYTMWGLGYDSQDYGASSATLCRSLKFNQWVGYHAILGDICERMSERIEAETDIKVPLFQRCLINNFKFGDSPMFHKDSSTPLGRTFMVYPNMTWDKNWGGYTVFADESGEVIDVAWPKPGRVAIFAGNLDHSGVAPTKVHKGFGRYSIAYQDPSEDGTGSDRRGCDEADVEKTSLVSQYGNDFFRLK